MIFAFENPIVFYDCLYNPIVAMVGFNLDDSMVSLTLSAVITEKRNNRL